MATETKNYVIPTEVNRCWKCDSPTNNGAFCGYCEGFYLTEFIDKRITEDYSSYQAWKEAGRPKAEDKPEPPKCCYSYPCKCGANDYRCKDCGGILMRELSCEQIANGDLLCDCDEREDRKLSEMEDDMEMARRQRG